MSLMTRPKRPSFTIVREEYNYNDPDSINPDLFCSICHDVFDIVKRTKRCKHLFCYACITQALVQNKSCPICRTHCVENEFHSDINVQNVLDQLIVYCNFSPECNWKGTRHDLKSHLQIECQLIPVHCNEHENHQDCKEVLKRQDIEKHRRECPHKTIGCPLGCKQKFYELEDLELHMSEECINRPVTCPLCNKSLLHYELKEHGFVCLNKKINCPHKNILGSFGGCLEEFERRHLSEHLQSCKFEPFKEAFRGINMQMMALERKIESIQRSYKDELDQLSTLKLHAGDVSTPEQIKNILKYNPAIRSLHLLDFQPGTKWQYLTHVLQTNDTITTISLKGSEIEKVGAVLLAKSLKNNFFIHTLLLTDNNIGDQGIGYLSKSLEISKTIKHIDLAGNNFGDNGMESLCRALESNSIVETLDLSWNNLRTKGIEFLSKVIERSRCKIHSLDLSNNDIGYKGIEFLAKGLETNRSIVTLNLEHSKVGNKGTEALSKSLEKHKHLQVLILAENHIDDRGAEFLSNALLVNQTLHTLHLEGNLIGDTGTEWIVKSMNKSALAAFSGGNNGNYTNLMKTIYLTRNAFSRSGIKNSTKNIKFVRVVTERE
ncbi:1485_t:CDS:2 [Funneliformis caledonium]|uniref:1485_t:CDS:1 n=1 Tax=Funneliformis caledonium TaxID=1117310 RepID=A0A9N8VNP5_9GLOM|nr:1485_t:CDS:2 [Funneliformis caledonium]